jgi:hypothetical protein
MNTAFWHDSHGALCHTFHTTIQFGVRRVNNSVVACDSFGLASSTAKRVLIYSRHSTLPEERRADCDDENGHRKPSNSPMQRHSLPRCRLAMLGCSLGRRYILVACRVTPPPAHVGLPSPAIGIAHLMIGAQSRVGPLQLESHASHSTSCAFSLSALMPQAILPHRRPVKKGGIKGGIQAHGSEILTHS